MFDALTPGDAAALIYIALAAFITVLSDMTRKWLSKKIDIWEDEVRRSKNLPEERDDEEDD